MHLQSTNLLGLYDTVTRCSYIVGEHGDSSVPIWSNVNIAGSKLKDIFPMAGEAPHDYEDWYKLHHEVVHAGEEIIKLKGYTGWGIGIMCAKLTEAILRNQVYFLLYYDYARLLVRQRTIVYVFLMDRLPFLCLHFHTF